MVTLKEIFGGFWMLVGGIITVLALWTFGSVSYTVLTGIEASGKVVSIERASGHRRSSYRPRARFEDEAGETRYVSGQLSLAKRMGRPRATHKVGDRVTIYYPAGRPEEAVLGGLMQHWSFLFMAMFSGAFVLAGFFILRSGRRERKELGW